ncbi:hypothetical protein ACW7BJ_01725 [Azospirillum argentinense]
MPAPSPPTSQFDLFGHGPDDGRSQQLRSRRQRVRLADLMRAVGDLGDDELTDLIRVALGESRRRGVGYGIEPFGKPVGTTVLAPSEPTKPTLLRQRASEPLDIPPGKLNLVRAALQAGFSPGRVAKEFGVSIASVRKLRHG